MPVGARGTLVVKICLLATIYALAIFVYGGPDTQTWFFWHPAMALSAVLPLATTGILVNRCNSSQRKTGSAVFPTWVHNVLMIGSLVLMWVSVYVIYTNKKTHGKPHFTSWHGQIGLVVVLLWTAIVGGSTVVLWDYPTRPAPLLVRGVLRRMRLSMQRLAAAHRLGARLTYLAALGLLISGWLKLHTKDDVAMYAAGLFVLPLPMVLR